MTEKKPSISGSVGATGFTTTVLSTPDATTNKEPTDSTLVSLATLPFTATAAAGILEVTRRSVIDWGGRGLVEAEVQQSEGRGSNRLYSAANLVHMAVIRELFTLGMTREQVKDLFKEGNAASIFDPRTIRTPGVEWLVIVDGRQWFVKHDKEGWIRTGEEPVSSAEESVRQAKWVVSISLTRIKQEVAAKALQ